MDTMPSDTALDSSLTLLAEGYEFIPTRCARHGSDVFATRLLFEPTICLRGADAAELVSDVDRFSRADAAPDRLVKTLFGQGGVQALDGEAHRVRKQLFLSLMGPDAIADLVTLVDGEWRARAERWRDRERVVLLDEATTMLTRAVCAWSGVPLPEEQVELRTADLAAMIDAAGGIGWRYVRGRIARERGNRWAASLVRAARAGRLEPGPHTALARVAEHVDADGTRLTEQEAAVELLNVIRPTVAIARYLVFVAMAMHRHPDAREQLRTRPADDPYVDWFVHEVRRDYPFFPFVAARVRRDFDWRGHRFPQGTRVLLDLYGTNHHAASWPDPDRFAPSRFAEWTPNAYDLIPQGAGDHLANHRCAGEWVTIAVMRHAARFLACELDYEVPPQDLSMRLSRMPAIPRSRFVLTEVRPMP